MKDIVINVGVNTLFYLNIPPESFEDTEVVVFTVKNIASPFAEVIIQRDIPGPGKFLINIKPEESLRLADGAKYDLNAIRNDGTRVKISENGNIVLNRGVGDYYNSGITPEDGILFVDLSNATAKPTDLRRGKTAYLASGLTYGAMPVYKGEHEEGKEPWHEKTTTDESLDDSPTDGEDDEEEHRFCVASLNGLILKTKDSFLEKDIAVGVDIEGLTPAGFLRVDENGEYEVTTIRNLTVDVPQIIDVDELPTEGVLENVAYRIAREKLIAICIGGAWYKYYYGGNGGRTEIISSGATLTIINAAVENVGGNTITIGD